MRVFNGIPNSASAHFDDLEPCPGERISWRYSRCGNPRLNSSLSSRQTEESAGGRLPVPPVLGDFLP
jgi:hypothetical protein